MRKAIGFLGAVFVFALIAACGTKDETARDTQSQSTADKQTPTRKVELIDRELLFGNPDRSQGRLSPDGRRISFRAPVDGVMNLWVAPAGNLDAAKPLTHDTGRGIPQHFWALDSEHLLYIRDEKGDENWHLYSIDLESREITDLTPYQGVNAQMIAQSEAHPGTVIVGMNDRDPRWHDVYRVDLETAERELILQNDRFGSFIFDNDLQLRLANESTPSGGFTVLEKDGEDWSQLFEVPVEDVFSTRVLGFDANNSGVYMLDSRDRDKAALLHLELESGKKKVLAESDLADISDVFFHPRSHRPIAYAVNLHTHDWAPSGINSSRTWPH